MEEGGVGSNLEYQ